MLCARCILGLDARGDKGILAFSDGIAANDWPVIQQMGAYSYHQPGFDGALSVFPLPSGALGIARYFEVTDHVGRLWSHTVMLVMSRPQYHELRCNPFLLVRAGLLDRSDASSPRLACCDVGSAVLSPRDDPQRLDALFTHGGSLRAQLVQAALSGVRTYIIVPHAAADLAEAVLLALPVANRNSLYFSTCVFSNKDMPCSTWCLVPARLATEESSTLSPTIDIRQTSRTVIQPGPYARFVAEYDRSAADVLTLTNIAEGPLRGVDTDHLPLLYKKYRLIGSVPGQIDIVEYCTCMNGLINGLQSAEAPLIPDMLQSLARHIAGAPDDRYRKSVLELFMHLCHHHLAGIAERAQQNYVESLCSCAAARQMDVVVAYIRCAQDDEQLHALLLTEAYDHIRELLMWGSQHAARGACDLIAACCANKGLRTRIVREELHLTCMELSLYSSSLDDARITVAHAWIEHFVHELAAHTDFAVMMRHMLVNAPAWCREFWPQLFDMSVMWTRLHSHEHKLRLSLWQDMLVCACQHAAYDTSAARDSAMQWYDSKPSLDDATWVFIRDVMHMNRQAGQELAQKYLIDVLVTLGYDHLAQTVVNTLAEEESPVLVHVMSRDEVLRTRNYGRYLQACMQKVPRVCKGNFARLCELIVRWTEARGAPDARVRNAWNEFLLFSVRHTSSTDAQTAGVLWHKYSAVSSPETWRFIMTIMNENPAAGSDRARDYLSQLLSSLDHWGQVQEVVDELLQRSANDVTTVLQRCEPRNAVQRQFLAFVCCRVFEKLAPHALHLALPAACKYLDLAALDTLPLAIHTVLEIAPPEHRKHAQQELLNHALRLIIFSHSIPAFMRMLDAFNGAAWDAVLSTTPRTVSPYSSEDARFVADVFANLTDHACKRDFARAILSAVPRGSKVWQAVPVQFHPEPPQPFSWMRLLAAACTVAFVPLLIWGALRGSNNIRPRQLVIATNEPMWVLDIPAASQSFWRSIIRPCGVKRSLPCTFNNTSVVIHLQEMIDGGIVSNVVRYYAPITNATVKSFVAALQSNEYSIIESAGLTNVVVNYSSGAVMARIQRLPVGQRSNQTRNKTTSSTNKVSSTPTSTETTQASKKGGKSATTPTGEQSYGNSTKQ